MISPATSIISALSVSKTVGEASIQKGHAYIIQIPSNPIFVYRGIQCSLSFTHKLWFRVLFRFIKAVATITNIMFSAAIKIIYKLME